MKVFGLFWILVFETMLKQYQTNVWKHFERKDYLNGYICDPNDFAFEPRSNTDKSLCAIKCTIAESCAGIFYETSNLQCFGCKLSYGVGGLNETLPGSQYYEIVNDEITSTFGTSRYFSGPTGQTFEEAVLYCQGHNAHLVQAETLEENEHLKTFFETQPFIGYEIWHGITDFDTEGLWKWNSTGDPLTGFNDWGRDTPENTTDRNCGKFAEGRRRKWTDDVCTKNVTYTVCEGSL